MRAPAIGFHNRRFILLMSCVASVNIAAGILSNNSGTCIYPEIQNQIYI